LLAKHLPVGFAIGIKTIMLTRFPSGFQFGRGDYPSPDGISSTRHVGLAEALPWSAGQKPVAIVDLEYNQTRFENDDMRDHRIVPGVRVLGDVEILLNSSSRRKTEHNAPGV
jgi:hypothetical protein